MPRGAIIETSATMPAMLVPMPTPG